MGLFSKSEDKPKITPSPLLPDLPKAEEEKFSELPSIPGDKAHNNMSEEMIKSAISDRENELSEDEEENQKTDPQFSLQNQPKRETIFVKIDTFSESKKSLNAIEEKVKELGTDLQELKEIKTKELKELNLWEEELKKINNRLSKIDTDIFGEV
jgi:PHP family Zn ribbon phosphoesterase